MSMFPRMPSAFTQQLFDAQEGYAPSAAVGADRRPPLTAAHVLTAVGRLLGECILPKAKHGQVLEFRRKVANSVVVEEAMDALRPKIDPLYTRYQVLSAMRYAQHANRW